jgi:outer membrane protein assembly factor BamB
VVTSSGAADWPTFRGNPQRTGNVDGKPGPEKPKVLWVYKSLDHFIASPVPAGDKILIAGVGVLGPGSFDALAAEPKGDKQLAWSKKAPWLKLPSVSAPAVVNNLAVFGDAMHQHSGAHLYAWGLDGEWPIYELELPGNLFHLEGTPTVVGGKAYFGCGNGGVLCVDLEKLTLKGKAVPSADLRKELDKVWDQMLEQYKIDYKKDPDFTPKPTKDKLPRPAPVKVWQEGMDKWHVDAPVNVVGDRLLFTSAFLDKEMVGDRAMYSLDLKTGKTQWRAPLPLNPWGGASVQDKVIVVTGSTIAYDPRELKGAKGYVGAYELETGKPIWEKKLEGKVAAGIQSSAALSDGKAIVTATDGKVRAYDLSNGLLAWSYDAKAPIFAPPAVASGVVYVGDLQGVVHAINLNGGTAKWTLNVGTDPAVKMPGMIYGGPVVHGGKVYVATCNHVAGPGAKEPSGKESAVICIGQ